MKEKVEARLKQQIELASATQDVSVVLKDNNTIEVKLSARSMSEGQKLSNKITALPELKRYRLDLRISLDKK